MANKTSKRNAMSGALERVDVWRHAFRDSEVLGEIKSVMMKDC
jgi:hypothetical protein